MAIQRQARDGVLMLERVVVDRTVALFSRRDLVEPGRLGHRRGLRGE